MDGTYSLRHGPCAGEAGISRLAGEGTTVGWLVILGFLGHKEVVVKEILLIYSAISALGRPLLKSDSRPGLSRGRCVQQDWRTSLPVEKALVFQEHERHLELLYNMFSVSLNEAIALKLAGLLPKALRTVGMSSELCGRMTRPLAGTLRALQGHAKHYGTVPNAAPLDPNNYHRLKGQRSARMSGLLDRVLFSHRLQFLHKVNTLEEMVEDLDRDFRCVATDLAGGLCTDPERGWHEVDAGHYDLNTCLRETIVLLKSFLVVLPAGQLGDFEKTVHDQSQITDGDPTRRHGRMGAFAGQ